MYKKRKRGQSMVEFAMLAPFIFLVIATIIEGSPLINAYIKVEKASESGARVAAIYGQTDNDVLTAVLLDLYKMSYKSHYDGFVEASEDTDGVSLVNFMTNCENPTEVGSKFNPFSNPDDAKEGLYRVVADENTLCFSMAAEQSGYGTHRTEVIIYPTYRFRINGSWTTVSVLHNYQVFTPILFFVADILSDAPASSSVPSWYKTVPIYKYTTRKIE